MLLLASQFVFLKGSLQRDLGMGVLAPGLTLDNFREIFTDPYFLSSLWLSISVSTVAMVITLLIAFPAAYVIARMQGHLSIVLLAAVVVSSFLSIVVKVLGLLLIFSSSGPLNRTLFWLGAITEPVTIVGNIPGVILGFRGEGAGRRLHHPDVRIRPRDERGGRREAALRPDQGFRADFARRDDPVRADGEFEHAGALSERVHRVQRRSRRSP